MTVNKALSRTKDQLQPLSHARLEADRLLAYILRISPSELFRHESKKLDSAQAEWLEKAIQRRLKGEPLAYILETQGFYKSDFIVRKGVLVPRPETEFVVESALRLFPTQPPDIFADLGCGSGCIGLSLLKEWRTANLIAVDASLSALDVTRENVEKLGLKNRCETIQSPVEKLKFREHFSLIVANPPYIAQDDPDVEENVRKFEPAEALFAAEKGLAAIFAWSAWAKAALKSGGWWITEIGASQKEAVSAKLIELGFVNLGTKKDLADHPRVVCAQKP